MGGGEGGEGQRNGMHGGERRGTKGEDRCGESRRGKERRKVWRNGQN